MTMNNRTAVRGGIDRRTLLAGVTSGIAALAGCSSSDETPPSSTSSDSGNATFESIEWQGTKLVVKLRSDVTADRVTLVNSSGTTIRTGWPEKGSPGARWSLLGEGSDGYSPGEYTLVAYAGDSKVGDATASLEPELTIKDVKWAKNHPEMDWEKDESTWKDHAVLEIENTGTAPSYLSSVQWTDAPFCRVKYRDTMEFYYNTLLPEGKTTVYSLAPVYQTEGRISGRDLKCGELTDIELTATAVVQAGTIPSYSQTIEYGGTNQSCELSISSGQSTSSVQSPSGGNS